MSKEINIEKMIPPYITIDIKQKDQNLWFKSIVLNAHERFIEVKLTEQFLNSAIMPGDLLQCMIFVEDSIYIIEAVVYNIKFISGSIVLKINDLKTMDNARKHKRYNALLSATFSEDGKLEEHYCIVLNISISGICIITKPKLQEGDIIEICINYSNSHFITAQYTVNWVLDRGPKNMYGLSIIHIDDKNKFLMSELIDELEDIEKNSIKLLLEEKSIYLKGLYYEE